MSFKLLLTDISTLDPVLDLALQTDSVHHAPPPIQRAPNVLGVPGHSNDLARELWGLVVPEGPAGDARLEWVRRLSELRQRQCGLDELKIFRVPSGLRGLDAEKWLAKYEYMHPKHRPDYLLLLGDLDEISLELQQELMVLACVGRLCFTTEDGEPDRDGYMAYCDKVCDAEAAQHDWNDHARLLFYASHGGNELETGYRDLIANCIEDAAEEFGDKHIESFGKKEDHEWAKLEHCAGMSQPAVLLSMTHGGRDRKRAREPQRSRQGALMISESKSTQHPVTTCLSHEEFLRKYSSLSFLRRGFWFLKACFGAGTPTVSAYERWFKELQRLRVQNAHTIDPSIVLESLAPERPFVARLPQVALAHSDGPLGVLGHVDLAWTFGYQRLNKTDGRTKADHIPYYEVIRQVVSGSRFGPAVASLNAKAQRLGSRLGTMYANDLDQSDPGAVAERAWHWMSYHDLQGYILLGDPAAQMPTRAARKVAQNGAESKPSPQPRPAPRSPQPRPAPRSPQPRPASPEQPGIPPLHLVIELVRAADVANAGGVAGGERNRYLLRAPDGSGRYEEGELLWDDSMHADLSACADLASAGEAVDRLAEIMRKFMNSAGWTRVAARIQSARAAGQPVALTVRSAAHELYTLPWELLDVGGAPVCETDCLMRYDWPGPASSGEIAPPQAGGRVLMAWAAAGGGVPLAEHIGAIAATARAGNVPFDQRRDVVETTSVEALEAALGAGGSPVTILHLLCHGDALPDGSAYGLRLDGAAEPVPPERIRALITPYRDTLRLVVVSACMGSNPGAAANDLGSVAQTIHEAGVPTVIASRYPLSAAGSVLLTQRLYQRLFVDLWSLEKSFLDVRAALRDRERGPGEVRDLDWAAVQLYGCADLGLDFRPWVIRPYRGLEPYGREHQRFFFGRDHERKQLCDRVAKTLASGEPRFLLVAGASSTGKSSLVLAGLAADLEAGCMVADGEKGPLWSTVVIRPGEGGVPTELLAGRLDEHRRARTQDSGARSMVMLVVDQLEELFTRNADPRQREDFLRDLWRLANERDGDVFIVATMRIEYMGLFGTLRMNDAGVQFDRELLASERYYLVRQMGPEQYERVICGPAEAVGVRLEPGLIGRLQAALRNEPGALPLLSYTLDQLWQKRSFATQDLPCPDGRVAVTGWWLTDNAYDELGGVEGALATTADALFARLSSAHQDELRRVLVQLVRDHEDPMLATRRRGWRLALRPDPEEVEATRVFEETVDALVASRLLVQGAAEDANAEPWLDLAHDSLIRCWPRLREWYRDDREWLTHTDELRGMAQKWGEEAYLLRGHRLSYQLEIWTRHRGHLGARDRQIVQAFLDACVRAEAEQARKLAPRWLVLIIEELRNAERAIAEQRDNAKRGVSLVVAARNLLVRGGARRAAKLLLGVTRPDEAAEWIGRVHEVLKTVAHDHAQGQDAERQTVAFSPDGKHS